MIRILIVDDHAVVRAGLEQLLSRVEDFSVIGSAADGREAIEAAHEQVSAWRRRVFEILDPEEREQAARLLTRLSQVLEEQLP